MLISVIKDFGRSYFVSAFLPVLLALLLVFFLVQGCTSLTLDELKLTEGATPIIYFVAISWCAFVVLNCRQVLLDFYSGYKFPKFIKRLELSIIRRRIKKKMPYFHIACRTINEFLDAESLQKELEILEIVECRLLNLRVSEDFYYEIECYGTSYPLVHTLETVIGLLKWKNLELIEWTKTPNSNVSNIIDRFWMFSQELPWYQGVGKKRAEKHNVKKILYPSFYNRPSRLGILMTSGEEYTIFRYQFDPRDFWPRLATILSEKTLSQIERANADFLFFLNSSALVGFVFLFSLFLIISFIVNQISGVQIFPGLSIPDGGLYFIVYSLAMFFLFLFSYVLYLASVNLAENYYSLVNSAFDTYRNELFTNSGNNSFEDPLCNFKCLKDVNEFVVMSKLFRDEIWTKKYWSRRKWYVEQQIQRCKHTA